MRRIGAISDTHGVFDPRFRDFLKDVDEVWHAGDFGDFATAQEISSFKPLIGVYGNCDGQDLRMEFPGYLLREVEGARILMTHIGGSPGHYSQFARKLIAELHPDVFICGHSHILKVMNDRQNNLLYINPGACGIQGWHIVRTALRFSVEGGEIKDMEVFELERR